MLEFTLQKTLAGLAFIIPVIFLLRWLLTRAVGTPEEVAERHVAELRRRLERGEIDQASFDARVKEIAER